MAWLHSNFQLKSRFAVSNMQKTLPLNSFNLWLQSSLEES